MNGEDAPPIPVTDEVLKLVRQRDDLADKGGAREAWLDKAKQLEERVGRKYVVSRLLKLVDGPNGSMLDDLLSNPGGAELILNHVLRGTSLKLEHEPGEEHHKAEGAMWMVVAIESYRRYRLNGMDEAHALEALQDDNKGIGFDALQKTLRDEGLLNEWPVGWKSEDVELLANHLTWEDIRYWVGRVISAPRADLVVGILLSAQGHLAPLLASIGGAIHGIPWAPSISAGKSRCAEVLVYLGGGKWFAFATIPFLRSARAEGPILLGIDEGDEAEKDNPGIKGYLLACHDWGAKYGKFGEPDEKGKRSPEEIPYGGPIFITFRKKPWPALVSRAILLAMEAATDPRFSDDGAGEGFRRLLAPPALWLRRNCEEVSRNRDGTWALLRTHEPDFKAKLDRVSKDCTLLRQRDTARTLLLIAELLGVDLEAEIRKKAIEEPELESENAVLIEAIESNPLFQQDEVSVEDLRLAVQRYLRECREYVDVSRNRFAAVLDEMGFSKEKGPTWKRVEREGRRFMAIFPRILQENKEKDRKGPDTSDKPASKQQQIDQPESPKGSGECGGSAATPYGVEPNLPDLPDPFPTDGQDPVLEEACRRAHDILNVHSQRNMPPGLVEAHVRDEMQKGGHPLAEAQVAALRVRLRLSPSDQKVNEQGGPP